MLRAIIAAVMLALAAPAFAQDHPLRGVALVIGQSDYSGTLPKLTNPKNDARAMDDLLSDLGFDVTRVLDGDGRKLGREIEDFVDAAKDADVALVYYSGHGIEAGGENYLVPVDADLSTPQQAGATLIPLSSLLDDLAKTVPVTIVLLDACRTNAFPAGTMIQPPGAPAPIPAVENGLAEMRGPTPVAAPGVPATNLGVVIGFAASPGQPALDGDPDGNSPYAAALLKHLGAGGYSFGDVMTLVGEEVYLKTKARQLPWVNSSLRRVLSFGKSIEDPNPDERAIKDGRRQLLLSIAAEPDATRGTVESIATTQNVPLDALYGMLKVLGVDTSKGSADLEQQLQEGARQLKSFKQQELGAGATDIELVRLTDLANRAQDEGAMDLALKYREQATARARVLAGDRDKLEAGLETDRLAFGATFADHAQTAALNFDYATAAQMFGEAYAQVARWDEDKAIEYKLAEADAFRSHGDFKGDNEALRQAIATYEEAAQLAPRETQYENWLVIENNLGWALETLGARDSDPATLERAAKTFELVLDASKQQDAPFDWAITSMNLGNVLVDLGKRDATNDRLDQAVAVLKQAREAAPRDSDPFTWARIEFDLGSALEELGTRDADNTRLEQSVIELNAALEVLTREAAPLDWSNVMNTLGIAFYTMGERGHDPAMFNQAADAFNAALKERTQTRVPLDWAMTQSNLANTIVDLSGITGDPSDLPKAVAAYRASLTELTIEKVPLLFASAESNLGVTLTTLGEANDDLPMLQDAADAFAAALTARTETNDPINWAMTEFDLAGTLQYLGQRLDRTDLLHQAEDATNAALRQWTHERVPLDWAKAQYNLGLILENRGSSEPGTATLTASITAYRNALQEFTRGGHPQEWQATESGLADALADLGNREAGTASLEASVEAYRAALEVRTIGTMPLPFAESEFNLGLVLQSLDAKGDTKALGEARDAFLAALKVYTPERYPADFADTQRNLGVVLAGMALKVEGTDEINAAIAAYEAALAVTSKADNPLAWADLENYLGLADGLLGLRTKDKAVLQAGRDAVAAAWEVYKSRDGSYDADFTARLKQFDDAIANMS